MIDFYTAATPNGQKVAILLEELQLSYKQHNISLKDGEQKKPEYIAMNPNGRIPVIIDHDGANKAAMTVFESGAIMYYLAEKTGRFFGKDLEQKTKVMQWLMFQMAGIGPMFGNYYFGKNSLKPQNDAYIERFEKEAKRLISVFELGLQRNKYIACDEYTIADMAAYTWMASFKKMEPSWFVDAPLVCKWIEIIGSRPAVQKAMQESA